MKIAQVYNKYYIRYYIILYLCKSINEDNYPKNKHFNTLKN